MKDAMVAARATKPIGARKAQSHPRRGLEALLPRPEAPISVRVDTIKRCRISDFNRDTDHDEPWPEKARSPGMPSSLERLESFEVGILDMPDAKAERDECPADGLAVYRWPSIRL